MKPAQTNKPANRREFFRGSARYALLAGLAAVSAVLVRKRGTPLAGQTCVNQGICRGCGSFDGCGLPPALSAKQFLLRSRKLEKTETSSTERGVHAASTSHRKSNLKRTEVRAPEST